MKQLLLKLTLLGVTCSLALVAFYSLGKTNENNFLNTVTRANCSQEVASPYFKKETSVDPAVVLNVIDKLEQLIETDCRLELLVSEFDYPPESQANLGEIKYKEPVISTFSREELRGMIKSVINTPTEYQEIQFALWNEMIISKQFRISQYLDSISHSASPGPISYTDDENIAYYVLSSHVQSLFYAELRDALLMRETALTNALCPPLIRAIEVSGESDSGCNNKHENVNSVKAGAVTAIHCVSSGTEFSGLTNYVRIVNSMIDNDCEQYVLTSQIAELNESKPLLPECFGLEQSSFRSNIVSFLSRNGDNEERTIFFMKLEEELKALQSNLAHLKEPPNIDTFEMFGGMVTNAMLNEVMDGGQASPCNPDQVRIDRDADDEVELLRLQMHYRSIFYNELLDVLMRNAK